MNLQWEEMDLNKRWELVESVYRPALRDHARLVRAVVNAKRPRRRRKPRYFIARLQKARVVSFVMFTETTASKVFHDVEEAKAWAVAMCQLSQ